MAFMQPEIRQGVFIRTDEDLVPAEYANYPDGEEVSGWFCRLSAPGYLDCTEWSGPFKTAKEAEDYLEEMYE
jgi:hypothetical protein